MTTPLRIVAAEAPEEVDLYAIWRAEIRARNWGAVHIAADRRAPVDLPDVRRRAWR